jgi:hypothetical protein
MEGMRMCSRCETAKPLDCFSYYLKPNGRMQVQSYCKPCRNEYMAERTKMGRRRDRTVRKPQPVELWPRQLREALLDVRAKKWRGPVSPGQLRPMVRVGLEEVSYERAA